MQVVTGLLIFGWMRIHGARFPALLHCTEVLGFDSVMNNVGRVLTPLCFGIFYGRKLGFFYTSELC